MNRQFDRCLTHHLRTPDGVRRLYILPYQGNLTERKFEELGKRLMSAVGHHYPHSKLLDYVPRLKSEWLTGREKFVNVKKDSFGTYAIEGENWWMFGTPEGDFAILDDVPKPIACEA